MKVLWLQKKQEIKKAGVLIILMLVAVLVLTTYAYKQHSTQQDNLLKASRVAGEIIENGNPVGETNNFKISSGEDKEKIVQFKNTGESAVFVRVSFGDAWIGSGGEWLASDNEYANPIWTTAWNNEWYAGDDGWYYYKRILEPNEITTEVLSSVDFETFNNFPEEYENANYQLFFTMEVVQYSDDMTVNSEALSRTFGRSATVTKDGVIWE